MNRLPAYCCTVWPLASCAVTVITGAVAQAKGALTTALG